MTSPQKEKLRDWKEEFEKQFCEDPQNPIYPQMRNWRNWNSGKWDMIPTVAEVEWFIDELLASKAEEIRKLAKSGPQSQIDFINYELSPEEIAFNAALEAAANLVEGKE